MSVQKIIQEAINKNPRDLKEALESELRGRIRLALEAKMEDDEEEDDEEDDSSEEDDEDEKDMKEEAEQIDEISGAKLGSYYVKSRKSEADLDKKRDASYDEPNTPENKAERKKLSAALNKRRWGQGKAMDKLTGSSFAKVPAGDK